MSQKKFSGAPFGVQTSRYVSVFANCEVLKREQFVDGGIVPIAKLNCLYLKPVLNYFYVQVIFFKCVGNFRSLIQRSRVFEVFRCFGLVN